MKKVTILAHKGTIATSVTGPMDVFCQAGQMWNLINRLEPDPLFEVEVVTMNGKPIKCVNGFVLHAEKSIFDVEDTDLIMMSCITNIRKSLESSGELFTLLRNQHDKGTGIASVCTSAFLLAETGLLNGKTATTHWGFVEAFNKKYPKVNLKPNRLVTDEGDLYCSGALNSGIDLAMYLVEKYCGHEVAVQTSKVLIHDLGRYSQAPYEVFRFQRKHNDEQIKIIQNHVENNFAEEFNIDSIARENGMSRRTFERRFKRATGDTPLIYLQRIRVEAAKRYLESELTAFDEISNKVGYENSNFFRELFKKHTGLLPTEYQKKFQRI